jgi:signal transduction histidine kinase
MATIGSLREHARTLEARNAELRREVRHHRSLEADLKAAKIRSERLLQKALREQESLRLLSRKLLSGQEDERKRISRDLHDVIAQALTSINVRLAGINLQTTADAKKLLRSIAVAQKLLEKSMEAVHRFAVDLRPSVLDDLGLMPALSSHLRRFTDEYGVTVKFTAAPAVEQLDNASRTALYRIAQEALVNIARHAGARRATVRIVEQQRNIRLEITDDGNGLRTDKHASSGGLPRLGLLGMKERAEMVGGTLRILSSPAKGTTIQVELPRPANPVPGNRSTCPTRRR